MRILSVGNRALPWSVGGYERTWKSATDHLRSRGHATRILTTLPDPSDLTSAPPADPDVFRELGWYWRAHEFPPFSLRAAAALERANARTLARHLRDFAPDAVTWWAMGGMSLSLIEHVRRARLPALGVVGDEWHLYGPEVDAWTRRWRTRANKPLAPLAERLAGVPTRPQLAGAARWAFVSQTVRAAAGSPPGSVVLHPGIDPARFPPVPASPWGWRLLYCGRLDPRKGIATAIEALARLPQAASLRVVGSGEDAHRDELEALARRLGVAERVSYDSAPPEAIAPVYAAADVLLFPVLWREPWGLAPLEAMATGRPVVASRNVGGASEYLREGENCLTHPPGDADALAACVTRLAGDEALRAKLVEGGRSTAAQLTEQAYNDGIERELLALVSSA